MKSKTVFLVTLITGLASALTPQGAAARAGHSQSFSVNCARGQTINAALARQQSGGIEIQVFGVCQEAVVIDQDDVTLLGAGTAPTVVGTIDVKGAARANIRGLLIRGVPGAPFNTAAGGINITEGGSANVEDVRIENTKTRGFQIAVGAATIKNVSIVNGLAGAFVFRSAGVILAGSISSEGSLFGMSLVASDVFAKAADITFSHDVFGLIIEEGASLEHVTGHLTANDNNLGILLAGGGIYAYGSFIEARRNSDYGILIDEQSLMSPLVGAPGGGPSITVADNPGVGISIERESDLELVKAVRITGNRVGMQVDNSLLRMADTVIEGNLDVNLKLTFGAKGEFLGSANSVAGGVKCDGTVLTRGSLACAP